MTKRSLVGDSIDRLSAHLGDHAGAVQAALTAMASQQIIPRIWDRDHTAWAPEPNDITNRLGWLDSPKEMAEKAGGLQALALRIRDAGYDQSLLLGMGGSSLAPAGTW